MAKHELSQEQQIASVRETVESIWIAIVLAFVLRAFVLEAFMIPTGSMAPRLMGQHYQFDCAACGYHFAVGPQRTNGPPNQPDCPSCRFQPAYGGEQVRGAYRFGGDRVLVLKYLYHFRAPRAWDVVVFKNPLNNQENYIKRLIGLPGQQVQIYGGDVYVRDGKDYDGNGVIDKADFESEQCAADKECRWHILAKPAETQKVMWQIIHDNDFPPDADVWDQPGRGVWEPVWEVRKDTTQWKWMDGGRALRFLGGDRSTVPFVHDREWFLDFYAYNGPKLSTGGLNVSNDLKLEFLFTPAGDDSRAGLYLTKGDHDFRAWVGADGKVSLAHGQVRGDKVEWESELWGSLVLPPLKVGRGHEVALTHADYRVTLWVNGKAVLTSPEAPAKYLSAADKVESGDPTEALRTPTVKVMAEGDASRISHIKLMRDVYYTEPGINEGEDRRPDGWGTPGNPMTLRKFLNEPDLDEFFVLGDNSPNSKDSRMWGTHDPTIRGSDFASRDGHAFEVDGYPYRYHNGTIPRYNMMGKAFFVYWPGGFQPPVLKMLPIVPNVGRMRLIR